MALRRGFAYNTDKQRLELYVNGDEALYLEAGVGLVLIEGDKELTNLISRPPLGNFRVKNIYVSKERKIVVEWDDEPTE